MAGLTELALGPHRPLSQSPASLVSGQKSARSFVKGSGMGMRYQVVIVGGGPVGVGLAVELGRRGISCAIVERRTKLQQIPKGQNLTQRTLEHFYFWGVADEIRKARAMPPGYPIGNVTA